MKSIQFEGYQMTKAIKKNVASTQTSTATSKAVNATTTYEKQRNAFLTDNKKEISEFRKVYKDAYSIDNLKKCRSFAKIKDAKITSVKKREINFLADMKSKKFTANGEITAIAFALVTFAKLVTKKYKGYNSIEIQREMMLQTGKDLKHAYPKFPESPMHFSLHKMCKKICMTNYDIDKGIFFDKCVAVIDNQFPLFYKSGTIQTSKEIGEYFPSPDIDYKTIASYFTAKEYHELALQFNSKSISNAKQAILRNYVTA